MIQLREARTDADLEAWIGVRRLVLPNESGGTAELLRAQDRPERLLLLAELDGRLAGTGLADRSDVGDRFAVKPRVLPWARRRGSEPRSCTRSPATPSASASRPLRPTSRRRRRGASPSGSGFARSTVRSSR